MKAIVALVALSAVLLVPLRAEEEKESSHRQAARELYEMGNPRELMASAFESMFEPMLQNMREHGLDEAKVVRVKEAAMRFATQVAEDPELVRRMISLYQEEFTEEELREIIRFHQTPVGRKALTALPQLMQRGAIVGQEIAERHQAPFQQELMVILSED